MSSRAEYPGTTPGPWEAGERPGVPHGSIEIRGDGVWIASINLSHFSPGERVQDQTNGFPSDNEGIANARMIVDLVNSLYTEVEEVEEESKEEEQDG